MRMNCDKFFIEELQKEGFDLDYKKVTEIYRNSRQSEGFKKRKAKQERDERAMNQLADRLGL